MRFSVIQLLRHVSQQVQKPGHSIMVSKISWITGEEQVNNYFSKYGQITYVHIPLDANQGIHKGYGFVHFANKNSATEAVEDLSRPRLDDTIIHVKLADDRKTSVNNHKKS
ncbi:hypothetical protein FO519_005545 [Halicephalobus sp. NKZ332]|nr:hypothetical protein FO519_005545 [Halicephalobus sp. NKZ332]